MQGIPSSNFIIIGSRGLKGIKEMMLESVSHKVSQLSSCPVLIVH
ncbi:universal stress protein [Paenibacillus sp. FSL R5-0473]